MRPVCILDSVSLVDNAVVLVDDRNPSLLGRSVHVTQQTATCLPHAVSRQDNQRGAVAPRALLKLIQGVGRERQGLLKDGRKIPLLELVIDVRPPGGAPPVKKCLVAGL